MRSDFSKLLCENPRPGSRNKDYRSLRKSKANKVRTDDLDLNPVGGKRSMHFLRRVKPGFWRKEFNENLSPLRRFLDSSVGRRWEDVYSEICRGLDRRKTIDQHVFDHLEWYVEKNTFMHRGRVFFTCERNNKDEPIEDSWSDYYVHPETRILHRIENKSNIRKEREEREKVEALKYVRKIGSLEWLICEDGVWYHLKAENNPPPIKVIRKFYINGEVVEREIDQTPHFDSVRGPSSKWLEKHGDKLIYRFSNDWRGNLEYYDYQTRKTYQAHFTIKKQLSSKEKKKYGIT